LPARYWYRSMYQDNPTTTMCSLLQVLRYFYCVPNNNKIPTKDNILVMYYVPTRTYDIQTKTTFLNVNSITKHLNTNMYKYTNIDYSY
jgi:hypothetical protein